MLYFEEDWTDLPVGGWTLPWKDDENAVGIGYQSYSLSNTDSEL